MAEVRITGAEGVQNIRPTRDPGVTASPEDFGSQIGAAMAGLGNALRGLGEAAERKQKEIQGPIDQAALTRYKIERNQKFYNDFLEAQNTAEPGAPGFYENLQQKWQEGGLKARQEWAKRHGVSDDALQRAELLDLQLQERYGTKAVTWQHNERVRKAISDTGSSVDELANAAAEHGDFDAAEEEIEEVIKSSSGLMTPEQEEALREAAKKRLYGAAETFLDALPPQEQFDMLGRKPGVTGDFVDKVVGVESGGNPNAKNKRSSATGLGQFINETWREFINERHPELAASGQNVLELRKDPELSREAVEWYRDKNAAFLESQGLPVTDGTLYLAHFAGPGGAADVLKANQGASVEAILGREKVEVNPFLKGKSAGQLIEWADRKMASKSTPSPGGSGSEFFDSLPFDVRQKLVKKAESNMAAASKAYLGGLPDYLSYLEAGGEPTDDYAPEEVEAMAGPEKAAEVREKIRQAEQYGADVRSVAMATPEEVNDLLTEREEALQDPENFEEKQREYRNLVKIISDRNKALADDPAAYVFQNESVVRNAFEQIGAEGQETTWGAAYQYAAATLGAQEHLGVPEHMRRILSKDQAAEIGRRFQEQREGGQNAAAMMQGLAQQWGRFWPDVFGELQDELPATALVIGAMDRPDQARAAEQLAEAAKVGKKTLADAMPSDDRKIVSDAVAEHMAEFGQTVINQPGGAQTFGTFHEGVEILALSYAAASRGPADAAQRAYEDVIGKRYTMQGTYRVPSEHDADAVARGAADVLRNLDGFDLEPPTSLAGLSPDEAEEQFKRHLESFGIWITAPGEDGLELWSGEAGDMAVVEDALGRPVRLTWQQLIDRAAEDPATEEIGPFARPRETRPFDPETQQPFTGAPIPSRTVE